MLERLSRAVAAAFETAPVEHFAQKTGAAASSAAKAARAEVRLAAGTAKAAQAARRSLADFDELNRMQADAAEAAAAGGSGSSRSSRKSSAAKQAQDSTSESGLLTEPLRAFWAEFQSLLAPVMESWSSAWQQLKTGALCIWQDLLSGLQLMWAAYGQALLDGAAQALSNVQLILQALWQDVLQPVLTNLIALLSTLWSAHLAPLWNDVLLMIAAIGTCLLELWNGILAPIFLWLSAEFGPVFAQIFNAAAGYVEAAVALMVDAADTAVTAFRGIADFLSAVFRGDWDTAWQAIGSTVTQVWDKTVAACKTAVNGIIRFINGMVQAVVTGINAVLGALNGLSLDIPDWVPGFGGKSFGFSLGTVSAPQIPYLAQGAVLPANHEFLAVLGDQSHGTNIEAPLDTIKQAVAEVMQDVQAGQMAGFETVAQVLREILSAVYGIELTDEQIGRAAQRWQRRQGIVMGGGYE